jgi:hypothetical protein
MEQMSQPVFGDSLARFLADSRVGGVELEWVEPEEVAEPYRGLLVHRGDMTSALEQFHGDEMSLEILRVMEDDGHYFREVVLRTAGAGVAVEYGVIEVVLPAFSASMRVAITEGTQPLGGLMNGTGLEYGSSPLGYFHIIGAALGDIFCEASGGTNLFGRYNQLFDENGICLARIVEILPVAEQ